MKASEIIRNKMEENGGTAIVKGYKGNSYKIWLTPDKGALFCEKTTKSCFDLQVFDEIVDYMQANGRKIMKGQGNKHKFGEAMCNENTVVGIIAINYSNPKIGDSVRDFQFAFSAILDWANIAYNKRGYLELK